MMTGENNILESDDESGDFEREMMQAAKWLVWLTTSLQVRAMSCDK